MTKHKWLLYYLSRQKEDKWHNMVFPLNALNANLHKFLEWTVSIRVKNYFTVEKPDSKSVGLNLPEMDTNIKCVDGKKVVFDTLRHRFVALTPEENVRQHFIHYLIGHLGYPKNLMGNEINISLNSMSRRCDTVLYRRDLSPQMIIEYKAPDVEITQKVFTQISTYNLVLRVDYLVVSNGISHYCCKMDYKNRKVCFLDHIPAYNEL